MSASRPPVLSAPDAAVMEHVPTLSQSALAATSTSQRNVPLDILYDIRRTAERLLAVEPLPGSVVLQFPDEALQDSVPVYWALQRHVSLLASQRQLDWQGRLYIAADTSYGNCCVDEVTAQHVNADLVVHYGHACLSPTTRLPVIYVFPKLPIDATTAASVLVAEVQHLIGTSDQSHRKQAVLLLYDVSYAHAAASVVAEMRANLDVRDISTPVILTRLETEGNIAQHASFSADKVDTVCCQSQDLASAAAWSANACCKPDASAAHPKSLSQPPLSSDSPEVTAQEVRTLTRLDAGLGAGRSFKLPDGVSLEDTVVCYLGGESLALTNVLLRLGVGVSVVSYDPRRSSGQEVRHETGSTNKLLMRRYVAVQRTRDAKVVALLVGTLGVAAYLPLLSHLRKKLQETGRRVYTISVGKLTPAKLANFQEIDVFVLLACPENSLVDAVDALPNATDRTGRTHSSRDFYRPIVSPFELLHALKEEAEGTHSWSGKYELELSSLLRESELDSQAAARTASLAHHALEDEGGANAGPEQESESDEEPHFSLITGGYVSSAGRPKRDASGSINSSRRTLIKQTKAAAGEVVVRNTDGTLTRVLESTAGKHLSSRSWRGLEGRPAGQAPSVLAVGRAGTASGYADTSGLAEGKDGVGADSRAIAASRSTEPARTERKAIELPATHASHSIADTSLRDEPVSEDEDFDLEPL